MPQRRGSRSARLSPDNLHILNQDMEDSDGWDGTNGWDGDSWSEVALASEAEPAHPDESEMAEWDEWNEDEWDSEEAHASEAEPADPDEDIIPIMSGTVRANGWAPFTSNYPRPPPGPPPPPRSGLAPSSRQANPRGCWWSTSVARGAGSGEFWSGVLRPSEALLKAAADAKAAAKRRRDATRESMRKSRDQQRALCLDAALRRSGGSRDGARERPRGPPMPKRAAAETSAKPPRKRPRQEGVNDPFLISDGEEAGSAGIEVAAGAPVASSFGGELCLDGDDYEDDSQAALDRVAGLLGEGAEVEAAPAPVPASSGQASTSSTGHGVHVCACP